jgi:hypothetical protein
MRPFHGNLTVIYSSPSGGLVENPQDATYYEYHLYDAKDEPYASFCFHYRSLKYLIQLNIIPQHDSESRGGLATKRGPFVPLPQVTQYPDNTSLTEQQFAFGVESLDTRVFDSDIRSVSVAISNPSEAPVMGEYFLKCPPKLSPIVSPHGPIPEPCKLSGEGITAAALQRPLPELPRSSSRQSSMSSLRSNCPSLTPSLMNYVESDGFENEEIRISTAQPLLIPSESMQALELGENSTECEIEEGDSLSDYTASLISSAVSPSPALPSPEGYVPTTGSVLECQLDEFESPIGQSSPSRDRNSTAIQASNLEATLTADKDLPRIGTLKLSEAEWLRHTPSPPRRRSKHLKRIWSPRPDPAPSSLASEEVKVSGRDHSRTVRVSDETDKENAASRDGHRVGEAGGRPAGNWI